MLLRRRAQEIVDLAVYGSGRCRAGGILLSQTFKGLKYYDTFSHIIALSGAVHIFPEAGDGFLHELACFGDKKAAEKTDLNLLKKKVRICIMWKQQEVMAGIFGTARFMRR